MLKSHYTLLFFLKIIMNVVFWFQRENMGSLSLFLVFQIDKAKILFQDFVINRIQKILSHFRISLV